jgi:pyrimidine-nucleoside phosphorylase
MNRYAILERKRAGEELRADEIAEAVRGAADGSWDDAELAAFLMAFAIRGASPSETRELTLAMLGSGELWRLGERVPGVVDKHSTGGVGDKVSLVFGPLLAACGVPVAMLTGRALGHTGGTADKLETIPGLRLDLELDRCVELLRSERLAIGVATASIAPADRRLYALRDRTGTVTSIPLVVGSILSKKLATGASALALDVKTGVGAFFPELARSRELAQALVATSRALGVPAAAIVSDMSQPLGEWAGHACEVAEALDCLEGRGERRLVELTLELAGLACRLAGHAIARDRLELALGDGSARESFLRWARAQGADASWAARPRFELAPVEIPIRADRSGALAAVRTRELGLLVQESSRDRSGRVDPGVSLRCTARLGSPVTSGEELARLYLRADDPAAVERCRRCFVVADRGVEPPLVVERVDGATRPGARNG